MKQNFKLVEELLLLWQVSRVADADETFNGISEYVSLIVSAQQQPPESLWQMRSAVSKPDIEMPDCARKQDLPTCPIVSLYGLSC